MTLRTVANASLWDFQEIDYPILWGGHLVRPWLWAGETPTPQEVIEYFFIWKSLLQILALKGQEADSTGTGGSFIRKQREKVRSS